MLSFEIRIGGIGGIGRLFVWDCSWIGRIGEIGRQQAFSIGLPDAATRNARACNDGLVAENNSRGSCTQRHGILFGMSSLAHAFTAVWNLRGNDIGRDVLSAHDGRMIRCAHAHA